MDSGVEELIFDGILGAYQHCCTGIPAGVQAIRRLGHSFEERNTPMLRNPLEGMVPMHERVGG